MLTAAHRVTAPADFRAATRSGRRGSAHTVVAHVLLGRGSEAAGPDGLGPARVGFVVGKTVGNSVVRHRVQRRLRHQVRACWELLPAGSTVVVRALPPSAGADSTVLGQDLTTALTTAVSLASSPRPARSAR